VADIFCHFTEHCIWLYAVQWSPLLVIGMTRVSHIVVQCIAVILGSYHIQRSCWKCLPSACKHTSHLTNTFIAHHWSAGEYADATSWMLSDCIQCGDNLYTFYPSVCITSNWPINPSRTPSTPYINHNVIIILWVHISTEFKPVKPLNIMNVESVMDCWCLMNMEQPLCGNVGTSGLPAVPIYLL
jgi:hypothetical protein